MNNKDIKGVHASPNTPTVLKQHHRENLMYQLESYIVNNRSCPYFFTNMAHETHKVYARHINKIPAITKFLITMSTRNV